MDDLVFTGTGFMLYVRSCPNCKGKCECETCDCDKPVTVDKAYWEMA